MSNIKYVGETALNALVAKIKSITGTVTGVMRFVGSLKELPKDNTSYNKGDVILVGTKEYVLNETDGNKVWVEIGDEKMWLSKNDIKTNVTQVNEKTKGVRLASIGNNIISIIFDFSNLVTKDDINSILDKFVKQEEISITVNNDFKFDGTNRDITKTILRIGNDQVKVHIDLSDVYNQINSIKANTTKYDFYEPTFEFNNNNGHKIKQKYVTNSGKEAGITIDLTDVYNKIDAIKTNSISNIEFNNILNKRNVLVKNGNGNIKLNLNGYTDIAYVNSPESHEIVTLDTEKFVNDLKAELINTGFVHDDSNTKTTFEEITYEEVENLFK